MKLIMFSVREDEKAAINKWETRKGIEITPVSEDLSLENIDLVEGFDGICIQQRTELKDERLYKKLSAFNIKQISLRTAGYDIVDMELAEKYNLAVTNVPAYSPRSVAELVVTQVMRLIRNFPVIESNMARGDFRWSGLVAKEIHTLTVGIIGAGHIGATTARLFNALGANVIAYDPIQYDRLKEVLTYKSTQKEVLESADIVSLHVPLDKTTLNLIDAEALNQMKSGAYLINAARGPVVDTNALIDALEFKKLAGAALDTLPQEQSFFNQDLTAQEFPDEHLQKLMNTETVLITPHIGFYTTEAVQNMVDIALDSAVSVIVDGVSENRVK
ncbi:D-2-hydroxyacid dehydrogenase [Alkalibacterium olivapovliticus]|uniref:D-lactate dehydrogenase n=1 Tax=Alkalibacterium olivapovliticus TaxID=99907 RepID=A0A2T0W904_9LACT|nr:D-2-hydroxyacid dehydrogenase [Alkalibacterium olivapovliticus]PRY83191.1 D-lactate dehydrogenase [Alkalibacterium olivapovliticus]